MSTVPRKWWVLAVVFVVGATLCAMQIGFSGNQGYDTKCGTFVHMSLYEKRAVVIKEISVHPASTTVARAVRSISEGCGTEVRQGYPGTTINENH